MFVFSFKVIRLRKEQAGRAWENLCMAMLGEQFVVIFKFSLINEVRMLMSAAEHSIEAFLYTIVTGMNHFNKYLQVLSIFSTRSQLAFN